MKSSGSSGSSVERIVILSSRVANLIESPKRVIESPVEMNGQNKKIVNLEKDRY